MHVPFYLQKFTVSERALLMRVCADDSAIGKTKRLQSWLLEWIGIEQDRQQQNVAGTIRGPIRPQLDASDWTDDEVLDAISALALTCGPMPCKSIRAFLCSTTATLVYEAKARLTVGV